jgi:hypothetical protein
MSANARVGQAFITPPQRTREAVMKAGVQAAVISPDQKNARAGQAFITSAQRTREAVMKAGVQAAVISTGPRT